MSGLLTSLRSLGRRATGIGREPSAGHATRAFVDFLEEQRKPAALDPLFDDLLALPLRWEIAPSGTLERLPLTADQKEQYDFAALCEQGGRMLYLLDSRPVWAPGIPYIPSHLVLASDDGLETPRPLGTFDSKPEGWVFAWQPREGAG